MNKTDRDWYMDAGIKTALTQTCLKMYEIMENHSIRHNESSAFAVLEKWLINKLERFGMQAEDVRELAEGTYD